MASTHRDELDEYAKAVGYALSEWAGVESAIHDLFVEASGIEHWGKAYDIIDAVVNFDSRLQMCAAALRCDEAEDPLALAIWEELSKRVLKFYKKRHQIAHFAIVSTTRSTGKVSASIIPYYPKGHGTHINLQDKLVLSDLQLRREKFSELTLAVGWFTIRLLQRRAHFVGPPEQGPALIVRIRALVGQIPADGKPLDAPSPS